MCLTQKSVKSHAVNKAQNFSSGRYKHDLPQRWIKNNTWFILITFLIFKEKYKTIPRIGFVWKCIFPYADSRFYVAVFLQFFGLCSVVPSKNGGNRSGCCPWAKSPLDDIKLSRPSFPPHPLDI